MQAAIASAPDAFSSLNPEQRAAVEHGLDPQAPDARALLLIAGAGSGKTLTLATRLARLVLAGTDPQRILLLSFSRRAAGEMVQRALRVLVQALKLPASQAPPPLPWAGTFHSVGARLLRDYAAQLGLSPQFTVHDRGDSEDLLNLLRQELGLAASKQRFPAKATCMAIYSRVVNSGAPLAQVLDSAFPWCANWEAELKRLFKAYVLEKQKQQVLDFDDLLLHWATMLEQPELAADVAARFDQVLVDEYQDTNKLQARILLKLKPGGTGLTVVGDDAQAIYAFRAAEVRNILDFPQAFDPPARVLPLTRNYRSTQAILDAANGVIAQARERYEKQLWTERVSPHRPELVSVVDEAGQANWVADRVLQQREDGTPLKQQAVLFRTSHHSAALELELRRRNIPFVKFGGLKFLEAAHIKDVLAILRWAENPRSRMAGFRVARLIPGMGPASVQRLLGEMDQASEPLAALRAFQPPAGALEGWSGFLPQFESLLGAGSRWPADLETAIHWYLPQLERLHEDAPARSADLSQLKQLAGGYADRERFLTELTLDPPSASSDHSGPPHLDEDYLILSTIHSAKGQEWKSVHLLNVVDGCIPSDLATGSSAEIEEERRLLYVAMTRARDHLHLLVPQRFHVHQQTAFGDRHVYGSLSRFIPPQVERLFTRISGAGAIGGSASRPSGPDARIDVMAKAREVWG